MKKTLIVAALAAATLTSVSAFAADGTINFTGNVTDTTCVVTNKTTNPLVVPMGNVGKDAFNAAAGVLASTQSFAIELTGCPATVTKAAVNFAGAAVAGKTDVLALTGAGTAGVATGVGIQLQDDVGAVVALNSMSKKYDIALGTNLLPFKASYISTTALVEPGTANAALNFTISYN